MCHQVQPEILTNRPGELVGESIRSYLEHLRTSLVQPYELDVATAYFNLGGWQLVAEELDHPARVRILLGAEPPDPERRVRRLDVEQDRSERQLVRRALEGHERDLEAEASLLGFTLEASRSAERLVSWLSSDRVEVRRLPDRFLHGKAWIVGSNTNGAIVGSANFTYAGLTTNLELALGNYDPHVVADVRGWFDELWDQAQAFDLGALYEARFDPHQPYTIYLRMLLERYAAELEDEVSETGGVIHLTQFQQDGVWRAKRILSRRNGVLDCRRGRPRKDLPRR